ncbi:helix-turn-helix domain-containing protein [Gracilibacillus sp. S3-1-1]|uniref:Helix-turn-helix domain-containing protein n=1 Tax=Gracilibacillus pellucidus TaxID=3095368 RepID=A0ACC6M6F6_9BACI|nr:helix-turn-helix domain-containing protein [Gracilibacillus sp. S3-1-1]MDX8046493.1 helix-turn-helix domain-containing protein [Gracilibacillus sp. S3-1-1]
MDKLYHELQRFGFSKYECQAYVGLLKNAPVTGYELSKRTGVPRSMIYEVLGKLMAKGAVFTTPSEPVKYTPLPAKNLIERLRKEFEDSFDYLEENLTSLDSDQEADVIWRIHAQDRIIAEMIEMLHTAESELWISAWEPQVSQLKETVDKRIADGVHVFSVLFGKIDIEMGVTLHHDYMAIDIAEERTNGHLTILAIDNSEVMIANFSPNGSDAWAIKTKDPALVLVAMEYMRHDIMYGEITKSFGSEKVNSLWQSNLDLTHIVTGKRLKYK